MNQPASLREQLTALEHLQELDLKIDNLKKNKGALPASLSALDASIGRLKSSVDTKKNAIVEIEKVQKQARAALDLNKDRLARSMGRLEAVQNTQEYGAVNKEIEQLNKMNFSLEDQNKKSTVEMETIQKEITELGVQLEKLEQERAAQAQVVDGQTRQMDKEIGTLTQSRTDYVAKIDRQLLARYDRVRMARAGLGIVPALGGRCKGCNMVVPPQLYNMVQKGVEVHSCPSCHRILFVPESATAPSPTA